MTPETLYKLEGLHTVETIMETLQIKRQSALNLLTKLKKEQHCTVSGGGKVKRIYKITMRKQRPRYPGMFDILNKHSPTMKLNPWYDHQVRGKYTEEDVLIDAIKTKSFRAILVSLRLFNHIKNWPRLYQLAKKNDCWQQVGALYDVAKLHFKVRRMPLRYRKTLRYRKNRYRKKYLFDNRDTTKEEKYKKIEIKWKVPISFRQGDLRKVV